MKTRLVHVSLPDDLLREIDGIVGACGQSAFLVQAAREAVKRRKLLRFLKSDEVAWKEEYHSELANGSAALDSQTAKGQREKTPHPKIKRPPRLSAAFKAVCLFD